MSTTSNFLLPRRVFQQMSETSAKELKKLEIDGEFIPFSVVRSWFENYHEKLAKRSKRKVITHINLRGGIGKTTCAINLSVRLSQYGRSTTLIDLDPQASATLALLGDVDEEELIFLDLVQNNHSVTDVLKRLGEGLFLLPSSLGNGLLDLNLNNPGRQKNAVKEVCGSIFDQNGSDMIVIDCPPTLGAIVISAICAATDVVIPVMGDPFSIRGLRISLQEIASICETFGLEQPNIHVLFNRMDRRERLIVETYDQLQEEFRNLLVPFPIRTSSQVDRTFASGETVFSRHTRDRAYHDYDAYARYMLGLELHHPS